MRLIKWLAVPFVSLTLAVFLLSGNTAHANSSDIESIITLRLTQAQDAFLRGNHEKSLELSQQAIKLSRKNNNPSALHAAMMTQAEAYRALGQYNNALNTLETMRLSVEQANNNHALIRILDMMGDIYGSLGKVQQATSLLNKGIILAEELNELRIISSMHNNLGKMLARHGDIKQARDHLQSSVKFSGQANDALLQATATINLARLELENNNTSRSQDLLHMAHSTTKSIKASHDAAYLLINIGRLSQRIKAKQANKDPKWDKLSYNVYKAAYDIAENTGDTRARIYALGYLGQLYQHQKRYVEALQLTNRAIFDAQRANTPEALYLWQWQTAKLLHSMGNIDAAIDSYRRAIYTLKSIRHDLSVNAGGAQTSFREDENLIFFEFADLLLQSPQRISEPDRVQDYLIEARETMEQLKSAELQDYFQDDCVTELQSRITRLDTLSAKTAVFYPILLKDRIELLLTLPSGIKQYTIQISKKEITQEIRKFRLKLEKRTTHQYLKHARKLYQWLIKPLQNDLDANDTQTLVIVPDSALRTIPMAALHDGKHFLINQYAIATTPGLTLTDAKPLKRDNMRLLLNGLTQSVQGFPALPNVDTELKTISKLYNSTILKDSTYLIDSVEKELSATPFRAVHIASHGQFKSDPNDSFLLTYDNKLNMDRLKQLISISKYRKEPVELLTLSACQTAAGDDRAALGLAGIAVKAGARSALATLWFINDQASSKLIADFYTQLKDTSLSKAKALQRAQVNMISNKRYKHPSYWAPFLLIGNWL